MNKYVQAWGKDTPELLVKKVDDFYHVINGDWCFRDNGDGTINVIYTKENHTCRFLGWVPWVDDYNATFEYYRDNKIIISDEDYKKIKKETPRKQLTYSEDDIPF